MSLISKVIVIKELKIKTKRKKYSSKKERKTNERNIERESKKLKSTKEQFTNLLLHFLLRTRFQEYELLAGKLCIGKMILQGLSV
jgi:hypothetical protein